MGQMGLGFLEFRFEPEGIGLLSNRSGFRFRFRSGQVLLAISGLTHYNTEAISLNLPSNCRSA